MMMEMMMKRVTLLSLFPSPLPQFFCLQVQGDLEQNSGRFPTSLPYCFVVLPAFLPASFLFLLFLSLCLCFLQNVISELDPK